jgi:hypothetical protein
VTKKLANTYKYYVPHLCNVGGGGGEEEEEEEEEEWRRGRIGNFTSQYANIVAQNRSIHPKKNMKHDHKEGHVKSDKRKTDQRLRC